MAEAKNPNKFKAVILESPYAGGLEKNIAYARRCMADMLYRGEAPFASHLLYTQPDVLDDTIPQERELGIEAGFAWKHIPGITSIFYCDLGFSNGMIQALAYCINLNKPFELRMFGKDNEGKAVVLSAMNWSDFPC